MFTDLFQLEQKPVTVFSSDDAGAPVLTKDAGSLKTLLKACLVTGYGDKTALGWQMLFESVDKNSAAFASQDPTASKYVIKIDNSTATSAKISAYQSMTDIDTGVKPLAVDNEYELFDGAWRLVGHSKAFILLLNASVHGGDKIAYPILFGDLPREIKRTVPVCIFWTARKAQYWQAGLQVTLGLNQNGNTYSSSQSNNSSGAYQNNYAVRIADNADAINVNDAKCKFSHTASIKATVLHDMYIFALPDSTWTILPMIQPLSAMINDVGNLSQLNTSAIKARTSNYPEYHNSDCAVPTDWWWA